MNSYKICVVREFNKTLFNGKPLVHNRQPEFPNMPQPPSTIVYQSKDRITVEDFESFIIEHEYDYNSEGRFGDQKFTKFIKLGRIPSFYSGKRGLLVLSGKKRDILDFCAKTEKLDGIRIDTIEIDMLKLETVLTDIKLVWAKNSHHNEPIKSRALSGSHLEETQEYEKLKLESEWTVFSFVFKKDGLPHPIMVTRDGSIVLQATYHTRSEEIEIVLDIFDEIIKSYVLKDKDKKHQKKLVDNLDSSNE